MYYYCYETPRGIDNIIMTCDDEALTGLYFEGREPLDVNACGNKQTEIFKETSRWLDIYFSGKNPNFTPPYKILNSTPFRAEVIKIMEKIPFGKVISYNDIAKEIAKKRGIKRMSAQAVGGAVGSNPICIIIPCHRVVGSSGYLTGYGGGIDNKLSLLQNEGFKINDKLIISNGGKNEI